ncbi:hypothetical protein D917_00967 [Trichinella nativa]|uniref:Uncharacterized protein n=1 Tax=Trichinella nativa TaxID=6335 RepID=A0A1Y3F2B8_9BILA|nr:hypothetical protein D917_00967 [Trichinella nativa]
MAVRVSGFQAVSNDLDLFREQLQDGLTVKEQLNAVTLHLNKLKLKSQVWLCDTENAIGNGKNVSGLKNTVKLQLGKYEWMSEDMTSKKKQLVELLEKHWFIYQRIPLNSFMRLFFDYAADTNDRQLKQLNSKLLREYAVTNETIFSLLFTVYFFYFK